jgi:hypothetical protein
MHVWVNARGSWISSTKLKGSKTEKALKDGFLFQNGTAWVSIGHWTKNETETRIQFLQALVIGQVKAEKLEQARVVPWIH